MGETVWDVDRVTSHFFHQERLTPFFRVRYSGYTDLSEQPLENLVTCPKLVEDMERRKGRKFQPDEKPKEGVRSRFPPIHKHITKKLQDPGEFVLAGDETLMLISLEVKSKKGNVLWGCRFAEFDKVKYVRRSLMEYYWPVESVLFILKLERRRKRKEAKLAAFFNKFHHRGKE